MKIELIDNREYKERNKKRDSEVINLFTVLGINYDAYNDNEGIIMMFTRNAGMRKIKSIAKRLGYTASKLEW
jgi:hypothetical protein